MKVALVTGAYKGLGFEWCRALAQEGYKIILTARRLADAQRAAETLNAQDYVVYPRQLDVQKAEQIEELRAWAEQMFSHLDLIVNNAGINSGTRAQGNAELKQQNLSIDHLAKGEVLNMVDVNALAPIMVAHAFRPLLRKAEQAKIINIGSWLGSISLKQNGGNYSYALSKYALNMMNRAFAYDVRPEGITSVVVNPGWVQTDMGGARASLSTEESVRSMIDHVLEPIGLEQTGMFFNYDGEIHPW